MTELLHQYATQQADRRPDAAAIVMGDERLTYSQLETASNQLARLLNDAGCEAGDRVCLFMPKCPDAVVAMHAVMKAGCAYVPIDLASPASRAAKIVESCEPRLAIVHRSAVKLLDGILADCDQQLVVGTLEADTLAGEHFASQFNRADIECFSAEPLDHRATPDSAAHILFTSGSTGTSKGVVIKHANVTAFVDWGREYFDVKPAECVSCHSPLHFDLSTYDIYGGLSAGAEVHLVPTALNLVAARMADFIRDSELTQWFSVPSILTYMAKFDVVRQGDFPALKRLMWCGEVLPTPTLIYWMQRLPHVEFTNLYGPTEATIASSYYTVPECPPDGCDEIPIGVGCDGEELLVLDNELKPLAAGKVGDLYIRGVGLSPGYWRDQEKTDSVFLPNPQLAHDRIYKTGDLARLGDDGLVYFLGRADTQIKSRGYRIELGEIETAFNAIGCLRDCAVVGVETGGFEGTAICCAYVPESDAEITPSNLRQKVSQNLPNYMLPSRWKVFDTLPKNANGKIDRRALKEMFEQDAAA